MGLETATTINQLVITNPDGLDAKSQGDDHIRLIKKTLKNTFPNVTGVVTATQADLDKTAVVGNFCFPGMIVMWSGTVGTIPSGWKLCNGVGTISTGITVPDLRTRFIRGTDGTTGGAIRSTGGSADAVVVGHTHTGSTNSAGAHTHPMIGAQGTGTNQYIALQNVPQATIQTGSAGAHTHTITLNSAGESGAGKNLPPYYALAFLIKN
jgi:microcystin-dependent protein